MRKRNQKLTLHRETIRSLAVGELRGVAGGNTTANCEEASHCACYTNDEYPCLPHSACFGSCSC